jgi:hypothetical protein
MRFSATLNVADVPVILGSFLSIVNRDLWAKRYRVLLREMESNVLLAQFTQDTHGLELRLGEILALARPVQVVISSPRDYALFSFMAAVVNLYDRVSERGKRRIEGMLRDGLNTDRGLRPFKSEVETMVHLMIRGFDVVPQDMEFGGGCDFLATRAGVEIEVECKSASGDLGRQIHRKRMIDLSWHVQPVLRDALKEIAGGSLVRVVLPSALHGQPQFLARVAEAVRVAVESRGSVGDDTCRVEYKTFDLAGTPLGHQEPDQVPQDVLGDILEREWGRANQHAVCMVRARPQRAAVILHVESRKPDKVLRGLMHDLKASARSQFTKQRPCVLVVQFLELSADDLLNLAAHDSADPAKASSLQLATNQFFANPDRAHIHTIVYRSQGTLHRSRSVHGDRIDDGVQEQGPTYSFRNPNNEFAHDPRYSVFKASA